MGGKVVREEWRTLIDWPNYTISNFGQVYSCRRDRLIKASVDHYGYLGVNVCRGEEWRRIGVHILVATEFVPGWFEGAVVNHKDCNKQNNYDGNLEWTTHGDNVRHAFTNGLNPGRKVVWRNADTGKVQELWSKRR